MRKQTCDPQDSVHSAGVQRHVWWACITICTCSGLTISRGPKDEAETERCSPPVCRWVGESQNISSGESSIGYSLKPRDASGNHGTPLPSREGAYVQLSSSACSICPNCPKEHCA
ncbi:hypothetical protein CB1_000294045 [Camelus ferus]|nr:hypothetical protein CB1_000294045 [Camelus ferus]